MQSPPLHLIIVGAGIAGLGAALALARQGQRVTVLERAEQLSEVGAGLQLGPNATRVLGSWGLLPALEQVAAEPVALRLMDAHSGREQGRLRLGADMRQRYGWPNLTLRRADLQALLLQAVQAYPGLVTLALGQEMTGLDQQADGSVAVHTAEGRMLRGDGLLGCDGVWSRVRHHLRDDGPPRATGHIAWRILLPRSALPAALPVDQTRVWLAPRLHAVAYPVARGESFNVVIFTHASDLPDEVRTAARAGNTPADGWDQAAQHQALRAAVASADPLLRALVDASPAWRLWVQHDRPALLDPLGYARGRVALLGDAAHPMRPHLAQGAAMGLEDAQALSLELAGVAAAELPQALARYAQRRWRRNARVQLRAQFNGAVMQAGGLLRLARNTAMAVRGEKLLDMPWLYGFQA